MASDRATLLRQVIVILATFVVAGVVCGFVWYWLWTPAPQGTVFQHQVFFEPDAEFRGTGLYMLVAGVGGLVLGLLFGWLFESDEVATLAAVAAGGLFAGLVMALVGHLLGPESAAEVARKTEDFERIDGDLHAGPLAAFVAFPGAAVLGNAVVLITFTRRRLAKEPEG